MDTNPIAGWQPDAALTAAAMASTKGVPPIEVDVQALRQTLCRDGVLLEPRPDPIEEGL